MRLIPHRILRGLDLNLHKYVGILDLSPAPVEALLAAAFENRILNFDEAAARQYGNIMGDHKEIGRPLSSLDGQIIAIAQVNTCAVATRNVRDYETQTLN